LLDWSWFLFSSFIFKIFLVGGLLCVIRFSSCNRSVGCYHFWKFVSF
jgi:hypothetical protein